MKIGIYGGTYSPVHNGQVRAALLFLERLGLDRLIIMPANVPPHKEGSVTASAEVRLEMCRAVFPALSPKIEVSDFEISKGGRSYSIDTVSHFAAFGDVVFLCGEDMIKCLDRWHRAEELMKLCSFAVLPRTCGGDETLRQAVSRLESEYGARIEVLDEPSCDISSTMIREMIKAGEDVSALVPEKVLEIITEKEIYGQ